MSDKTRRGAVLVLRDREHGTSAKGSLMRRSGVASGVVPSSQNRHRFLQEDTEQMRNPRPEEQQTETRRSPWRCIRTGISFEFAGR